MERVATVRSDVIDEAVVNSHSPETLCCRAGCRAICRIRTALPGINVPANVGDEILLKKVLSFRSVLHRNSGASELRPAEDDVLLDKAVVAAVDCNGPFQAVINGIADKLKLIPGVRRVYRSPKMMNMQRIASDVVGARIERCRASPAEILKLNIVDIYVGAIREQRMTAGAGRGLTERMMTFRVRLPTCGRSFVPSLKTVAVPLASFAPRWS